MAQTKARLRSQFHTLLVASNVANADVIADQLVNIAKPERQPKQDVKKAERKRDIHFDVIADLCAPTSEKEREYYITFRAGWIAKCANACRAYPPEKIRSWFGKGGWWETVRCKDLKPTPPATPDNIAKTITLAAAHEGYSTASESAIIVPFKTGDSFNS